MKPGIALQGLVVSDVAVAVLATLADVLEAHPELRDRYRAMFAPSAQDSIETIEQKLAATPFPTVAEFMVMTGLGCERTGWTLVKKGMPTVGAKRSRRVDGVRALAWLRSREQEVDSSVERAARVSARRAAQGRSRA